MASADARYRRVRIFYPHSPLYQEELEVVRSMHHSGAYQYEVSTAAGNMLLPVWMTDAEACNRMRTGSACCCVDGYLALAEALEGLRR